MASEKKERLDIQHTFYWLPFFFSATRKFPRLKVLRIGTDLWLSYSVFSLGFLTSSIKMQIEKLRKCILVKNAAESPVPIFPCKLVNFDHLAWVSQKAIGVSWHLSWRIGRSRRCSNDSNQREIAKVAKVFPTKIPLAKWLNFGTFFRADKNIMSRRELL